MEAATPQRRRSVALPTVQFWPRSGRGRAPMALLLTSALVALLALAPVGFLLEQALSSGWDEAQRLLFRPFVGDLLVNTTELVAVTTLACVLLGVAVAWAV